MSDNLSDDYCSSMKKFLSFVVVALTTFVVMSNFALAKGRIVVSSYPWQVGTVDEMLVDFKKMGFDKVSMFQNMKIGGSGKFANIVFSYKMSDDAKAEAKAMFDKSGVRVVSIGHIYLDDEKEIEKLFKFAKYFGVEVMTVEAKESALPIYEKFSEKYGIKCGLYNHPVGMSAKFPYAEPDKMLSVVSLSKNILAFPDCGHWGRSNLDIVKCAEKLKGKILAVNVQNLAADKNCEEYSKGSLPIKKFVETLKKDGFNGYYIVMFNKAKDRSQIEKVEPSVKFLESCGIVR